MEIIIVVVAALFVIPFPAKWKFIWRIRLVGLALVTLTGGLSLARIAGLSGEIGGAALILASGGLLYLALRQKTPSLLFWEKKK